MNALDRMIIGLRLVILSRFEGFINDERGDTNFISLMVILAIVLAVAVVFIGFKDQITEAAQSAIDNVLSALGG